jgi:hypothetical protein
MNLRSLILQVADKGPADPREIVAAVLAQLSKNDERDALEQALPHMVRAIVLDRTRTPIVPEAKANAMPSAKRIAIQANWKRQLSDRYSIPGQGYKFLRDMTFDDVVAAARLRFQDADRVRAAGDYLMSVADAVSAAGVATVGELDEPILRELAGKQAAA